MVASARSGLLRKNASPCQKLSDQAGWIAWNPFRNRTLIIVQAIAISMDESAFVGNERRKETTHTVIQLRTHVYKIRMWMRGASPTLVRICAQRANQRGSPLRQQESHQNACLDSPFLYRGRALICNAISCSSLGWPGRGNASGLSFRHDRRTFPKSVFGDVGLPDLQKRSSSPAHVS